MRHLGLFVVTALLAGIGQPVRADEPPMSYLACANQFEVTAVDGDPQTVVLHVRLGAGRPVTGTATLYGADHAWTAAVQGGVAGVNRGGVAEQAVTVRAGAPIIGVQFAPAWATCSMVAAVRRHERYDGPDPTTPALIAADAGAIPPSSCKEPYRAAKVVQGAEPMAPAMAQQQGISGEVAVAVALDAQGHVVAAAIRRSPSVILNNSALGSARASTFEPAVVGCRAVPSSYEFVVSYG